MPRQSSVTGRRWLAGLIITMFFMAVAGAASIGWWYARESPPHQGPIVLISVVGLRPADLTAYGGTRPDTAAIDALIADSVVFERAYTHSPQTVPAHASLLSGQLPFVHGVRDDLGFTLPAAVRTLAEQLRNRGFNTGAAVSTFLLAPQSGLDQGFSFFDAELEAAGAATVPTVTREGSLTIDATERWLRTQDGRRFFLFVQVDEPHASAAVGKLSEILRARDLYDDATIFLVGERGDDGTALTLDDSTLRVPVAVKQPGREGAGRVVAEAVQYVDVMPTILDLVRAPIPGGLPGRSLRAVLDDADNTLPPPSIYAESLAAYFRTGGQPLFALTTDRYRFVQGAEESFAALAGSNPDGRGNEGAELNRLRLALQDLVGTADVPLPSPPAPQDEERFALLGYLGGLQFRASPANEAGLSLDEQRAVVRAHREAAVLIGQKNYSAGIRLLQTIGRRYPTLATVHFQAGALLVRTGRLDEGADAFRRALDLRPDSAEITMALADALLRAGQTDNAQTTVDSAIALAENGPALARAAAHSLAARVALARKDSAAALQHAEAAYQSDATVPVPHFIRGRLLYVDAEYEKAIAELQQADALLKQHKTSLADLHLYLGEALAHVDRYADAEAQFREELRAFPRNIQAYTSLAMLYRASNRDAAVEDVLNELVGATPTPEGYAVAARLWTILGDRSRAEALRTDARTRFRDDPSLVLLGRETRR